MGQFCLEGHARTFYWLGLIIHPIPVLSPCSHMLDNALEQVPVVVSSVELVLGFILTPDGDEIPHLLITTVV